MIIEVVDYLLEKTSRGTTASRIHNQAAGQMLKSGNNGSRMQIPQDETCIGPRKSNRDVNLISYRRWYKSK